jgi:hypothetical protein
VAPANAVEVMIRGWIAAVTVRGIVAFAVKVGEPESVTLMAMEKLPVTVGVPEMTPLLPRLSPVGRPLADQV